LRSDDLTITDHRYGTTLDLLVCDCGFRFAAPSDTSELVALYRELDDQGYEESSEARRAQQRVLLSSVMRAAPNARSLLDVGAANGLLVEEAERAGLIAVGVEPSERLAASGRSRGVDVLTGVLEDGLLGETCFDVVTLVDVIEHVADPIALLGAARAHLSEAGRLLVVTPDVASVAARVLRERWWHLRAAHVGYFDRTTLGDALERSGFLAERWWRPGWVFEVGYLGERLGEYIRPARWVTQRARGSSVLRRTIPLNLRDSLAVIARRSAR
jgi:SAM-dependent methyltransferase